MSVIFFHSGFEFIPGGFIGVDIFFALSGFLITSIIYPKILQKTFSFSDFYKRRARRLLPASMAMTFITVLTFSLFYPPDLFSIVTESALASLAFVSNIYFWQTTGYFSPSLGFQPLLHTWSLSVEEQFYFIFPLTLFILCSVTIFRKFTFTLLSMACGLSLLLSVVYAPTDLSFIGFYILPTRFYEMGLGALLAVLLCHNPNIFKTTKLFRECGLFMIVLSLFFYTKKLSFPSFYPLLPIIGTLLIIADNRQEGWAFKAFTFKPFVWVGVLSYSLYLWHWPLWVALKWFLIKPSSITVFIYFITLFIVSSLSYYLIENPMRKASFYSGRRKQSLVLSVLLSTISVILFLSFYSNENIINKPKSDILIYQSALIHEPYRNECTDTKRLKGKYKICELSVSTAGKYNILLWGDSHASALMSALVETNPELNVYAFNTSGCPPLLAVNINASTDCREHNEYIKKVLTDEPTKFDLVLNVGAWNNYIDYKLVSTDNENNPRLALLEGISFTANFYDNNGINFLFLTQFPRFQNDVPMHYFRDNDSPIQSINSSKFKQYKALFSEANLNDNAIIDLSRFMCDEVQCLSGDQEMLYYRDSHHISKGFGKLISHSLSQRILDKIVKQALFENSAP
jgi:peptidoglycan/LPS O-acetylase OafA/YrhL